MELRMKLFISHPTQALTLQSSFRARERKQCFQLINFATEVTESALTL